MASISSARKVSVISPSTSATSLLHGGDLTVARRQFPQAPEPFIDLSSGINPHSYPLPQLPSGLFAQLPQQDALDRLLAVAAKAYGAPSSAHVVAAPGTQILLPAIAALLKSGRVRVLGPTYNEHLRVAELAGQSAAHVHDIAQLEDADLAVVVNPNNPDGRAIEQSRLLALADRLRSRGGLLVLDEAFMDVASPPMSLAGEVMCGNIIVLRSFGKFFGLAGLRLGFAIAAPDITGWLNDWLGPWAVAGPAIAIGEAALADVPWAQATRERLHREAQRLDAMLSTAGLAAVGGTALFRLVRSPSASAQFHYLGRAGILVRRFAEQPDWLRFGLPGDESAWTRLRGALTTFG